MHRWIATPLVVALAAVAGLVGYRLVESKITADIYRDRLISLSDEYETLRQTYNEAVRRTAVTELLVEGDTVCVTIRTAAGVLRTIPTPYAPTREIYVDYVVVDGRLWIRRVFDARTPPDQGVMIDPALAEVDWQTPAAPFGKAIYSKLSEGRWIVTASGDGSLGIRKIAEDAVVELTPPPQVREYEQIERDMRQEIEKIGVSDVVARVIR